MRTGPAVSCTAPMAPWTALPREAAPEGFLSYFYVDDLSGLPTRAVTKLGDNKSDPNVETGTYGLFSTCSQAMRSSVVNRGARFIFFVGRHSGERKIVGYYEVGWYAAGPSQNGRPDYALAAHRVRFVAPPLRARDLPPSLRPLLTSRWRMTKRVDARAAAALATVIQRMPDATDRYVAEVRRLERLNRFHSGYAYPTWGRVAGFDWSDAASYLKPRSSGLTSITANSTPSNTWECANCAAMLKNKALLKRCPACGELGSLQPVP